MQNELTGVEKEPDSPGAHLDAKGLREGGSVTQTAM